MKLIFKPAALVVSLVSAGMLLAFTNPGKKIIVKKTGAVKAPLKTAPKIQAAILLDVSNSMDGLIEQAKAQLWNMVSTMGKAQCNQVTPQIEIALYEYGRSNNDSKNGYVKQISGFSTDLDQLSKSLFSLTTNGGDEYCGHVIYSSINELNWDTSAASYKVIFIAGNEDFLQGDIQYTRSCTAAKDKGVIVNTIYCGDRMQGIREHWNLSSECAAGSFTNINQDAKIEDIPTPYDSTIYAMNNQLNTTYIGYGYYGSTNVAKQAEVDQMNVTVGYGVAAKRAAVKSNGKLYNNASWDLADAYKADDKFIEKVDMKTLPDSLQRKSRAELKVIAEQKLKERGLIQQNIQTLNAQRETYIAEERKKRAAGNNTATLESEVEKIIKEQAKRYNMIIQ